MIKFLPFFLSIFLFPISSTASDIWYTPNVTNYTQVFMKDNKGEDLKGVAVFKLLYENIAYASDSELRSLFSYLKKNHVKFALEVPALVWTDKAGYKVEGFAPPGFLKAVIDKIKINGGELSYVSFDEPYYYAEIYDGVNKAKFSDRMLIEQILSSIKIIHNYYPTAKIGDIEPFTQIDDKALLTRYFKIISLLSKNGEGNISFIDYDPLWEANWILTIMKLHDLSKNMGMKIGVIFNAKPDIKDQVSWLKNVILNMQSFKERKLPIDNVIIQSWGGIPIDFAPRKKGKSHLGLIDNAIEIFN